MSYNYNLHYSNRILQLGPQIFVYNPNSNTSLPLPASMPDAHIRPFTLIISIPHNNPSRAMLLP